MKKKMHHLDYMAQNYDLFFTIPKDRRSLRIFLTFNRIFFIQQSSKSCFLHWVM